MTALLAILTPRAWGFIGAAVVLGALITFGGVQTARLNHAKADLVRVRAEAARTVAAARAETALCQANRTQLQAAIEAQNMAVAAQRAAMDRQTAALANAAQRARQGQGEAERRAAALLAGRAGADACRSGLEVARELP